MRNSSRENDVIFDPFMGTGTTGLAAKNENRNFIGCEINEKYFNMAKSRISKDTCISNIGNTKYGKIKLF